MEKPTDRQYEIIDFLWNNPFVPYDECCHWLHCTYKDITESIDYCEKYTRYTGGDI